MNIARRRRLERLHLVEGLLLAMLDIDEVIQVIRTSDDADAAKSRLMAFSIWTRSRLSTSSTCVCAD